MLKEMIVYKDEEVVREGRVDKAMEEKAKGGVSKDGEEAGDRVGEAYQRNGLAVLLPDFCSISSWVTVEVKVLRKHGG